jgi:hypothetical protein
MLSSFYKVVQNYDERRKRKRKEELDGVTLHVCRKQPEHSAAKEQQKRQQFDVSKEVAAIKVQLLVLLSRLDRIE